MKEGFLFLVLARISKRRSSDFLRGVCRGDSRISYVKVSVMVTLIVFVDRLTWSSEALSHAQDGEGSQFAHIS